MRNNCLRGMGVRMMIFEHLGPLVNVNWIDKEGKEIGLWK